jgi:hypothetical protein
MYICISMVDTTYVNQAEVLVYNCIRKCLFIDFSLYMFLYIDIHICVYI